VSDGAAPKPSDEAPAWPPVDDRGLWRWIVVAHALPLVAWAIGVAFWVHGVGVGPFRPTSPITWMVGEPLLALALYLGRARPFAIAVIVQAIAGLVLIGTLLQAPEAFLNAGRPGSGVEEMTYLTLGIATLFATGTGRAFVGQAAYVLRLSLSRR
jgi:hypothetical protein